VLCCTNERSFARDHKLVVERQIEEISSLIRRLCRMTLTRFIIRASSSSSMSDSVCATNALYFDAEG
jgi:hypothetical protein